MPFSNNHMSSNIFLNNHDQDHDDDDDDGDDVDDDGRICVFLRQWKWDCEGWTYAPSPWTGFSTVKGPPNISGPHWFVPLLPTL